MSKTKVESKILKDPPLTGVLYEVNNPPTGAPISNSAFFAGRPFKLAVGKSLRVDETIAKAAQYVWGFLQIAEVPKIEQPTSEEQIKDIRNDMARLQGADVTEEPRIEVTDNEGEVDLEATGYNELRKIAAALKISNTKGKKIVELRVMIGTLNQSQIQAAFKQEGIAFNLK